MSEFQRPTIGDVERKFADALGAAGLHGYGSVVADGKWHHFRAAGDRKGKKAWYRVFYDDWPAGSFGHFSRSISEKWSYFGDDIEMSPRERAAIREKQRANAEQREKADTAKSARNVARIKSIWEAAGDVVQHGYLSRKQVGAYGLRQVSTWVKAYRVAGAGPWLKARLPHALLVPMQDATGAVVGLQAIFDRKHDCLADGTGGDKDFAPGSKLKGGFHVIGDVDAAERIVIAEGYATGASVYDAFDHRLPVVVAFTGGNLLAVAKIIRSHHRDAEIVVAGDDDRWHPKIKNSGRADAIAAAAAAGGVAAVVDASALDPALRATDYNDIHVHHPGGLAEVRRQIDDAIGKAMQDVAERQAAEARARRPLIEPRYPAVTGTVQEARELVSVTVADWAAAVPAYHLAEPAAAAAVASDDGDDDKVDAETSIEDQAQAPTTFIRVDTGIGKTEVGIDAAIAIVTEAKKAGRVVGFSAPNHGLNDELRDRFRRAAANRGYTAEVYRGRGADDPEAPGEKMCRRHEEAEDIGFALSSADKLCSSGDETCPFAGICGSKRQAAKKRMSGSFRTPSSQRRKRNRSRLSRL
jgi:phage/plasmid primase-like uncharacterized protein